MKLYLKYREQSCFGIVASDCNVVLREGKAIVAGLENVNVWDIRKGELISRWKDPENSSRVTCIASNGNLVAVGYSNGTVRMWSSETNFFTFSGHKKSVTALAFKDNLLASGSADNEIVIWDFHAEAGLFRLLGHKGQITSLTFVGNYLLSVSKDTLMKAWDLTTKHCVETIIAHNSEVWSMASFQPVMELEDSDSSNFTIVTGSAEGEVRVWSLDTKVLSEKLEINDNLSKSSNAFTMRGMLERQSKERIVTIKIHETRRFMGTDRLAEIYKIRTQVELKKREARLRRRQKEKVVANELSDESILKITDEIPRVAAIRCSSKIRSIDLSGVLPNDTFQVLCALSSNQLEVHTVGLSDKDEPTKQDLIIDSEGHRNDIRTLSLSSDDSILLSGSHTEIKLWNIESRKCIGTIDSGYALCSSFIPGNNHVVVGTKTGYLELFDLSSNTMISSIQAHDGAIWSLQVWPDKRGVTTGSADKEVKFWEFSLEVTEGRKQLCLIHTRTLKLTDDVLSVCFSHDGKLLAVALLDATVKVFYVDTLKFFLSLYGHTLPVMSMDISSDCSLIATGSADKSIKIWGLDFGDCHKSLRAHDDSVMSVRWIFGTHYIVSSSKDKCVKFWDGDKFEKIMQVEGHHGEVWSLAVGKYGNIIVSGSHDRSIRVWEKTDEQFVLEEERERELEKMYDQDELEGYDKNNMAIGSGVVSEAEIDGLSKSVNGMATKSDENEVGMAARTTIQSLMAGEKIVAALDIYEEELENLALDQEKRAKWEIASKTSEDKLEPPKPEPRNIAVVAAGLDTMPPAAYLLHVFEGIRSADLEQALMVLSFVRMLDVLKILLVWVQKKWNISLTSRILTYILKSHYNEITTSRICRPILLDLKSSLPSLLKESRDIAGFNLAALQFMKKEWEGQHSKNFNSLPMEEEEEEKGKGESAKKRKRVVSK